MAAQTTVTLLKAVPASFGDALTRPLAVSDRDAGDVLKLDAEDARALVRAGYARFGSPAQEAAEHGTLGDPRKRAKTATLDFPSIAAGKSAALTVAVPHAAVGELVAVAGPAGLAAGLVAGAAVSAAGTVTVTVANTTAAAVDPASGAWTVVVVNHAR